jgi:hypothetical protein
MVSFLRPGTEPIRSDRFKGNNRHVIAATIRDGGYDDIVIAATEDGDLHFMQYAMRGEFFWLRTELGGIRRMVAVNACSFAYAGETIFQSEAVIPYVQVCFWENGVFIERGEPGGNVYVRDFRDRQLQRNE